MKRTIITILICMSMLSGCVNKDSQVSEPVSLMQEDGTVSLKDLYFSDGKNTITNLRDDKIYEKFKKIMANESDVNGNIGDYEFSGFEINSEDESEMCYVSFTEDKQVFQITISPNYSAPEGIEPSKNLTLAGVHLLDQFDDVINLLGTPSEINKDGDGKVSTVTYNETESSFLYISFDDDMVNYIAVQFE